MSRSSERNLLILHAVRLLGFANVEAVAARAEVSADDVQRVLREAECAGWVQHLEFADLDGWGLTDAGRIENERQLAAERARADPDHVIAAVYRDFLPLNARLVRTVTAWQVKPTHTDPFAANDHGDEEWDGRVVTELTDLGSELEPLVERLAAILIRFTGYATRYAWALSRATAGQPEWVDKTDVDSCHRVWFQLHEDLVATLGIDRRTERSAGAE